MWLYFRDRTDLLTAPLRLLHVAPEVILERRLHPLPNLDYLSADLDSPTAMVKMDLTDIDMPIMDGIALALAVGRDYPKMKIIIMSGHEHQIERAHGLNDLVYRVVSKPFTIAGICAVVDEVIGTKKPKSAE